MKKLVIFASGNGSNAEQIIKYFNNSDLARVTHLFCNKLNAGVLAKAAHHGVPTTTFSREDFYDLDTIHNHLKSLEPDLIILAGFLWKVPANIIKTFKDKVINIHPALLPKYGGKGMYGDNVHNAVLAAREDYSGITIHFVNEIYDSGKTIVQVHCPVYNGDTAESLATRIHKLEHHFFPITIEHVLKEY